MTQSPTEIRSPLDNPTYNVLSALTSKLEAIEVYRKYEGDDPTGETGALFRKLADEDSRHADQLLDALRKRIR